MAIINITSNNFANLVMKASKPTLVLFWAVGSPHYASWDALLHELDAEGDGTLGLCKVSANYAPHIAMRFHIATYPTLALFRDGKLVGTTGGAATMGKIKDLLATPAAGETGADAAKEPEA